MHVTSANTTAVGTLILQAPLICFFLIFRIVALAQVDIVGPRAAERHVEVVIDVDPALEGRQLVSDPFRLRQVRTGERANVAHCIARAQQQQYAGVCADRCSRYLNCDFNAAGAHQPLRQRHQILPARI